MNEHNLTICVEGAHVCFVVGNNEADRVGVEIAAAYYVAISRVALSNSSDFVEVDGVTNRLVRKASGCTIGVYENSHGASLLFAMHEKQIKDFLGAIKAAEADKSTGPLVRSRAPKERRNARKMGFDIGKVQYTGMTPWGAIE